jgi:hypothetical protein
MTPTTDKQKERYYKAVLAKATETYALWFRSGMTSKGLVAQANAFAFDKRLKTDAVYRFRALAFACALGMRIDKRYAKLLQKLFRLFAFLRERDALVTLKRVLGFQVDMDAWEMVSMELEKLAVLLSQRNDQETRGGGKHSEMGDLLSDDALESFLAEIAEEEAQKTGDKTLTADKADGLGAQSEQTPVETVSEREQLSVKEFETTKDEGRNKESSTKEQKVETLNKEASSQKEAQESGKQANSTEKMVENVATFAESVDTVQEREEKMPSPFPVFRENHDESSVEAQKDTVEEAKAQTQPVENEKSEGAERSAGAETEQDKTLFPVFNSEAGTSGGEPDKVSENSTEKEVKSGEVKSSMVSNLSEENKAIYELMNSLDDKEITSIVNHIKEAAKLVLDQEETAWREQVSVMQNSADTQMSEPVQASKQNNSVIIPNAKK